MSKKKQIKSNPEPVENAAQAPSVEQWLEKIQDCSVNMVGQVVQTGQQLCEAKEQLKGEWERLKQAETFPYGARKTEMLMLISKNSALAEETNWQFLPNHWTTLAILAALTPAQVSELLAAKTIHVQLDAKGARALIPTAEKAAVKHASVGFLKRATVKLQRLIDDWDDTVPVDPLREGLSELKAKIEEAEKHLLDMHGEGEAT